MPPRRSSIPIMGSIPPGVRLGISSGFRIGSLTLQSEMTETGFKPNVVGRDNIESVKRTTNILEKLLSLTRIQLDEVLEKLKLDLYNDGLIDQESLLSATIGQLIDQIAARKR